MAMKKKLDKAAYDALRPELKTEYIADGDGYKLDLTDDEDVGPLRRALEREKSNAGTSKARVAELEAELEALSSSDARKKGDIATLEKGWEKRLTDQKTEFEGKISKLTSHTTKSLVDNVALSIATKISSAPQLILPHIRARLQADFEGDEPKTSILDKDGKVSKMTVDELSAEFVANKDFSAIITASKASGGASKPSQTGGGANLNTNDKPADLSKMNAKELAAHLTEAKANQT